MNSVLNKTRLAEKQNNEVGKNKENYKKYNHQLEKAKTKLQKRKQYELNKKRTLIRKQNESNKEIKQNERKQKRQNIIDEDIDLGRFFEIALTNKICVNSLSLHEIENVILLSYGGDFEVIGKLSIGDHIRQTHIRCRNIADYEHYINVIDKDYESDDAIFNGYTYKLNTPQFNVVNISQYGNGCDFKYQIIENHGNKCYIPSNSYCFVTCINFLIGKDYKQQFSDFIRNEKRLSNFVTMARIQPCLRKLGNNLGYYNGKEIWPRNITESKRALKLLNNNFCLICKYEGVSFKKVVGELERNFETVDNYITEDNVKPHFE